MRQTLKQYHLHRRHSLQTVDQYVNHNWNVLAELSTHPRTKQVDMGKEPLSAAWFYILLLSSDMTQLSSNCVSVESNFTVHRQMFSTLSLLWSYFVCTAATELRPRISGRTATGQTFWSCIWKGDGSDMVAFVNACIGSYLNFDRMMLSGSL